MAEIVAAIVGCGLLFHQISMQPRSVVQYHPKRHAIQNLHWVFKNISKKHSRILEKRGKLLKNLYRILERLLPSGLEILVKVLHQFFESFMIRILFCFVLCNWVENPPLEVSKRIVNKFIRGSCESPDEFKKHIS